MASLFAPAVSTKQKVETLHELNDSCGFGELQREFLGVNGVAKLVEIATSDWPAGGALACSCTMAMHWLASCRNVSLSAV